MKETARDLEELQALLDRSIGRAGDWLRSAWEMPDRSLSAAQLARHLAGSPVVSLATITARGEPRVAPINALFWRGRFYLPTVYAAARARHVRVRPAVSLTYYSGGELAIIVHGQADTIRPEDPTFDELDTLLQEELGESVLGWGEGVYLKVEPDVMYTYASDLGRYPE